MIKKEKIMNVQELIRELPKGIINWYEFEEGKSALLITGEIQNVTFFDALKEVLQNAGLIISCRDFCQLLGNTDSEERVDYVIAIGVLEYSREPVKLLSKLNSILKEDGTLLLGTDNRLGIRYFCGDRDAFTGRNFDGIENYYRINASDREQMEGRAYCKSELEEFLNESGFTRRRFYSVLPELTAPQLIFAEDYLPEEELDVRYIPSYRSPDTVFLEEEQLYTTLIKNGLFHVMANSYLIECAKDGVFSDVKHVTLSMERGRENALATIIRRNNVVEKRAIYPKGKNKLVCLRQNEKDLRLHGVPVVEAELKESRTGLSYVMPFIQGEIATSYFRRLLKENKKLFLEELDSFWELILNSSEHVPYEEIDWEHFDPDWEKRKKDDPNKDIWKNNTSGEQEETLGVILKRGYIDLVLLNCFKTAQGFVFYDQEFYVENLPANVILLRSIDFIYWNNSEMEAILPRKELQERYHLNENLSLWQRYSWKFIEKLRNEKELKSFHELHRRDMGVINSNRQRMNYSENEYQKLFRDIFRNTEGRKIFLFGSGNFTRKFLSEFGKDYQFAGILDNNQGKWGTKLSEIEINSPQILAGMQPSEYKVIVCIKNYVPVIKQLQQMGVQNYAIYDWNLEYPRKQKVISQLTKETGENAALKKYHTGYVAGVFDMFHKGHLNLLRRAKEQCDYLIVGVVTDEEVRKNKGTNPVIPFEERMEIVEACRYVDEAVEIPPGFGDTNEAYRRYRFDVQFSGSDYADDPEWIAKQTYLRQRGSDLVFFSYTESTSSTKLKEMIAKKLL